MRPALRAAWQQYLGAMRGAVDGARRRGRERRVRQNEAARALVDALASQSELDDLARHLIGLPSEYFGEERPPIARVLQSDVVLPYVYRHRFDHDVLDWALAQWSWHALFWQAGFFDDFIAYDRATGDGELGARYYLLTLSNQPRHWRLLLHKRVQRIDFALHEMSHFGPLAPPQVVALRVLAALALYDQAPAGVFEPWVRDELDIYRAELADWIRYDDAGRPGGDFTAWCAARGSSHRFSTRGAPPIMRAYLDPSRW